MKGDTKIIILPSIGCFIIGIFLFYIGNWSLGLVFFLIGLFLAIVGR
jgi:hypothetical protein